VNVKQGQFNTGFITPKKMAFGDTNAQVFAWAYSENNPYVGTVLMDQIVVSGVSSYADSINDQLPPEISIQTCLASSSHSNIADGDRIRLESPGCLQITIEDSTAIDFREEADEGISFEVTNMSPPFHPWPYLEQTSKKVVARMNFAASAYSPGVYEFKVQAFDYFRESCSKISVCGNYRNAAKGLSRCL
jgi:hypothetical protein